MENLYQCTFPDGYAGLKHSEIRRKYQLHQTYARTYTVLCCKCCMEVQKGLILRQGYVLKYLAVNRIVVK